jgi:hypothetical protein
MIETVEKPCCYRLGVGAGDRLFAASKHVVGSRAKIVHSLNENRVSAAAVKALVKSRGWEVCRTTLREFLGAGNDEDVPTIAVDDELKNQQRRWFGLGLATTQ